MHQLKLEGIDEYRSFSIKEPFSKEYNPIVGGDVRTFPVDDMYSVDIINGEIVTEDSDLFIISKTSVSYTNNPITEYGEQFEHLSYSIEFVKQPDRPVVIKNFLSGYLNRVISTVEIVVSSHISLDLMELNISDSEILSISNRVFSIDNGRINYSRLDFTDLETALFYNYCGDISFGEFTAVNLSTCGNYSMDNWNINILTESSSCDISGVIELDEEMRHGSICKINHRAGGSRSSQEFRHILRGSSYAMYDGDTNISPGASESVSSQVSKTILISPDARVLNKPRLNIYNSDVKATHGATVGKLDPESVFYLKQRGYPQDLVEKLLLDGFSRDILDRISCSVIKEFIYDKR